MESHHDNLGDLLNDARFREWIFRPTGQLDRYWQRFSEEHPAERERLALAREILLGIKSEVEKDFPGEVVVNNLYQQVLEEIQAPSRTGSWWRNGGWAAAACLIAGLLLWPFWNSAGSSEIAYEELVKESKLPMTETVNDGDLPVTVVLADSSKVSLNPGAKISYCENFNGNKCREIYLDGTAFFDIEPDPERPFYVYSNELITKVLGTSFWVYSCLEKDEMLVEVVRGKVSVTTRELVHKAVTDPQEREILVTPNQQVVYTRKDVKLTKSLVSKPVLIARPQFSEEFVFDDAPAYKIFDSIEKFYGVKVRYDKGKIGDCLLTASLTDESLFEMIEVLCTALNARYFVEGTQIIIEGNGCQGF